MSGRLLLGLDTATPVTTVGLVEADVDGTTASEETSRALAAASHRDARRHGEVLPGLVVEVLGAAGRRIDEVTDVAVGIGPGAYTGLRVGLATAQALGLSLGVPVHGVATVDAFAYATGLEVPFVVVTDARRREVYVARYADHRTRAGELQVATLDEITSTPLGKLVVVSADTPSLGDVDVEVVSGPTGTSVCSVVVDRLRRGLPSESVRPLYLRRPDVTAPVGIKSVLS